jgi:hypothetical protein
MSRTDRTNEPLPAVPQRNKAPSMNPVTGADPRILSQMVPFISGSHRFNVLNVIDANHYSGDLTPADLDILNGEEYGGLISVNSGVSPCVITVTDLLKNLNYAMYSNATATHTLKIDGDLSAFDLAQINIKPDPNSYNVAIDAKSNTAEISLTYTADILFSNGQLTQVKIPSSPINISSENSLQDIINSHGIALEKIDAAIKKQFLIGKITQPTEQFGERARAATLGSRSMNRLVGAPQPAGSTPRAPEKMEMACKCAVM